MYMDFHQFLYLNKILSILVYKMESIDYLKSEFRKINNLFLKGKFDLVIKKAKKIIEKNPKQIPFYNLLALSYREKNNLFFSEKILLEANKINPNDQSVIVNLGATYRSLFEFEKSEKHFQQALLHNSKNINALVNYANLKRETNKFSEAIKLYNEAYELDNNNEIILINLAGVYQIIGKFEISKKLLEKLLNINPKNILAHKMLSIMKRYEIKDKHQEEMLSLLKENSFTEYERATLYFAISKSYEDQKNYKKSSDFFIKANSIQKIIHKNYSIKNEIKLFEKIKKIFKKTIFKKYTNFSANKELIFIVGLPRSGTTLAHQILAAHSKVYGADEMVILDTFLQKNMKENNDINFNSLFENYNKTNEDKLKKIVENFFSKISYLKTNKNIILDKNPLNFQWLGFIKILFPSSKIIHCTRNLNDTALSLYKNAFEINSIVWSNDENDIAKYISIYIDLMKFWEEKLPKFIYNLNYEKLIEYKEKEIQELLKFCNLDWEDDCLNFSKKQNPIKTVSVTQARNAIYNTSLKGYKKYEDYLNIFKKIKNLK